MFNLLYFLFEFFRNKTFSDTINNPVRIDWHDWMSDYSKGIREFLTSTFQQFVSRLKSLLDSMILGIKLFIEGAVTTIKDIIGSIVTFIKQIWEKVTQFFDTILEFFADIWDWIYETVTDFYEYLSELVSDFWQLISETCVSVWESFQELLWWIGEWHWELLLSVGDSLIGWVVDMISWLFETLLPEITLPQGFDQGVVYFIQYGMLLNELLPIREALSLFAIYVAILVVAGIFHFILKHLPIIGG